MAVFALVVSNALIGCETQSTYNPLNKTGTPAEVGKRALSCRIRSSRLTWSRPQGFASRPTASIRPTHRGRRLRDAIDRYWDEVRTCATGVEPPGDTDVSGLIEEFPRHLAVEIANNWKVVEGPTTHRRMQAFPSIAHPGSWSTARRREDALQIVVVPELNGLGPQMVNELNLWLNKNANVPPTVDLVSACASVACVRFNYNNAPSQAWSQCKE